MHRSASRYRGLTIRVIGYCVGLQNELDSLVIFVFAYIAPAARKQIKEIRAICCILLVHANFLSKYLINVHNEC